MSSTPLHSGEQTSSAGSVGAEPATPESIADLFSALRLTVDRYGHLTAGQFQQLCEICWLSIMMCLL